MELTAFDQSMINALVMGIGMAVIAFAAIYYKKNHDKKENK